ncbi:PRTRC system protein F [Paraburkholderia sp. BL10I2N1]|uniref:PRTRC system protein F n=1 Tax=Paraburkholderia sp. BL10I2N1 TaxID=1938796 RepID=UPI00105E3216|nr:PRTRC system protein F [Paraburkholderia sp. BL10I2N1]TDN59054.1 PRTRC genetic system protein F [Paraburkholderia sp. BL10I2N1]
MFFDPRPDGEEVAISGVDWQPARRSVARRGPADGFLTLPDMSRCVPVTARLRWQEEREIVKLVESHFEAGPLRAADVPEFTGAGNAMARALFAWFKRQCGRQNRVRFRPVLLDINAVQEQIQYQYQYDAREFTPTSPLYLGFETPEDYVYIVDGAQTFQAAHPRLLQTALILINRAAGRTLRMRTPDDFLGMFAQWFWDGHESCTDEEAAEVLADRFGEDPEEFQAYLPSVVREELCPAHMEVGRYNPKRFSWMPFPALGIAKLRVLQRTHSGRVRRLCVELERLTLLLAKAGKRRLFDYAYTPETVYHATTVAAEEEHLGDLLDTHYEYFNSGGDGSLFHGFIGLATSPDAIRKQYADLSLGLSILQQVDRVVALITRLPRKF